MPWQTSCVGKMDTIINPGDRFWIYIKDNMGNILIRGTYSGQNKYSLQCHNYTFVIHYCPRMKKTQHEQNKHFDTNSGYSLPKSWIEQMTTLQVECRALKLPLEIIRLINTYV